MKRATLSAYPTTRPSPPTDLTDRLLAREAPAATEQPQKRRRSQPRAERARRAAPSTTNRPETPEALPSSAEPPASLMAAIDAADFAANALRSAGHEAPARYEVALRYRLDALAHHLQQVKEFVAALASR